MCVRTLEAPEKRNSNDERKETKRERPPSLSHFRDMKGDVCRKGTEADKRDKQTWLWALLDSSCVRPQRCASLNLNVFSSLV